MECSTAARTRKTSTGNHDDDAKRKMSTFFSGERRFPVGEIYFIFPAFQSIAKNIHLIVAVVIVILQFFGWVEKVEDKRQNEFW